MVPIESFLFRTEIHISLWIVEASCKSKRRSSPINPPPCLWQVFERQGVLESQVVLESQH